MPQERAGLANQKDRKDISGISTEQKMKRYGKWLQSASRRLVRTEGWQEAGKEPEETPRIDGESWKPRGRPGLQPKSKEQHRAVEWRILQSSLLGVLICQLSGKGFGGKREEQEEGRLILVMIQAYGDKNLVPASETMGQLWGTMRTWSASRKRPCSYILRRVLSVWTVELRFIS